MGKRLEQAKQLIDVTKVYETKEAVELAIKTATAKFKGNLEIHIKLGIDPKKTEQVVRGTLILPHGSGKSKVIAAFVTEAKEKEAKDAGAAIVGGEDLIKKIKETGKIEFEVAVAEPAIMPKLAVIAKVLGPKGLMPNPKTGTVTPDIGKAVKEYASGKVEFKNDDSGNLHQVLGKIDFGAEKLIGNLNAFLDAVKQAKPSGLKNEYILQTAIHATMGPAIKIKV